LTKGYFYAKLSIKINKTNIMAIQHDIPSLQSPQDLHGSKENFDSQKRQRGKVSVFIGNMLLRRGSHENPFLKQVENEATYPMDIGPAAYAEQLSSEEIVQQMEIDHVVKTAPQLSEQLHDDRPNAITYLTSSGTPRTLTEHEALVETNEYLETAIACADVFDIETAMQLKSLHDNLTFIGQKEYQEAASGIATYWKALLENNPDQQLLVLAGIAKEINSKQPLVKIKSDDYLLDTILTLFSNEEVEQYRGRLITDVSEIKAETADDLKTVLLDDWTISGNQLRVATAAFRDTYPKFASTLEIQLVAGSGNRIAHGLTMVDRNSSADMPMSIPVKAYFKAHDAPGAELSGAHITGAHSSVDYDFETIAQKAAYQAEVAPTLSEEQHVILDAMPPIASIYRPYQQPGFILTQKDRFNLRNK
jgi:hypothetical protein